MQEAQTMYGSTCGKSTWEPPDPVSVAIPARAYAAIEHSGMGATVAWGIADVFTSPGGAHSGFWSGSVLRICLGEHLCVELALDPDPQPGWCEIPGDPISSWAGRRKWETDPFWTLSKQHDS